MFWYKNVLHVQNDFCLKTKYLVHSCRNYIPVAPPPMPVIISPFPNYTQVSGWCLWQFKWRRCFGKSGKRFLWIYWNWGHALICYKWRQNTDACVVIFLIFFEILSSKMFNYLDCCKAWLLSNRAFLLFSGATSLHKCINICGPTFIAGAVKEKRIPFFKVLAEES